MQVSGQLQDPLALFPGKNPGIPWAGLRTGLDTFGEAKNLLPLLGFEPLPNQPAACSLY